MSLNEALNKKTRKTNAKKEAKYFEDVLSELKTGVNKQKIKKMKKEKMIISKIKKTRNISAARNPFGVFLCLFCFVEFLIMSKEEWTKRDIFFFSLSNIFSVNICSLSLKRVEFLSSRLNNIWVELYIHCGDIIFIYIFTKPGQTSTTSKKSYYTVNACH